MRRVTSCLLKYDRQQFTNAKWFLSIVKTIDLFIENLFQDSNLNCQLINNDRVILVNSYSEFKIQHHTI